MKDCGREDLQKRKDLSLYRVKLMPTISSQRRQIINLLCKMAWSTVQLMSMLTSNYRESPYLVKIFA